MSVPEAPGAEPRNPIRGTPLLSGAEAAAAAGRWNGSHRSGDAVQVVDAMPAQKSGKKYALIPHGYLSEACARMLAQIREAAEAAGDDREAIVHLNGS